MKSCNEMMETREWKRENGIEKIPNKKIPNKTIPNKTMERKQRLIADDRGQLSAPNHHWISWNRFEINYHHCNMLDMISFEPATKERKWEYKSHLLKMKLMAREPRGSGRWARIHPSAFRWIVKWERRQQFRRITHTKASKCFYRWFKLSFDSVL